MGTIYARDILYNVGVQLGDPTHVLYPWRNKLRALNNAQRQIVLICPDASTVNESVQLVPGTKQTIPASGVKFMKLIRNMGDDGDTPGDIIDAVTEQEMNQRRGWHTATAATNIAHYIEIPNNPRNYYVYPPVHGTTAVYAELLYSSAPDDVVVTGDEVSNLEASTSTITLDDIYATAIEYFIIATMFAARLNKVKEDPERAAMYKAMFLETLGLKQKGDTMANIKDRDGAANV